MLKQLKRFSLPCLSALLAFHLSACDSSSGTDAPPERTVLEPVYEQFEQENVQIQFPPPVSQTESETLTVRGIVQNAENIVRLHIDGIDVVSDDGFATWTVEMPLEPGLNTLQLTAEDAEGNSENLSQLLVTSEPDLVSARKVRLDRTYNRLLALDFSERALIAVDLDTGTRSRFSPPSGSENLITAPTGLLVHEDQNAVLVAQALEAPLLSIDLATGMQSEVVVSGLEHINFQVVNQAMTPSASGVYIAGRELVYRRETTTTEVNEDGEEVEVSIIERVEDVDDANIASLSTGIIYHLDLLSGERTLVSNFDTEDGGRRFSHDIRSISTTPESNFIYVLERFEQFNPVVYVISTVDKATGRREDFELVFPEPEEDEEGEGSEDAPESSEDPIESPDEEDATETVEPPPALTLTAAQELQLDYGNNRLWLLTSGRILGQIDLASGQGEIVAGPTVPAETDFSLRRIESFTLDALEQRVYLSDIAFKRIVWVDTSTGERHLLTRSGPDDPDGSHSLFGPNAVALDLLNHRAFVTDQTQRAVYRHNLLDGTRTQLPRGDTEADEVALRYLLSADFDNHSGRLTVLDNPLFSNPRSQGVRRLLDVDPNSGVSTNVFQYNLGNREVRDALYDPHSGAYFILERGFIFRVVAEEGRTPSTSFLSGADIPNRLYPFSNSLRSMVLDAANERLLVLDMSRRAVMAVDWDTGERSFLSRAPGNPAPDVEDDGEVRFEVPRAMSLDPLRNRVLVLDSGLKAIIAVDLETGERSVVASNSGITGSRLITPRGLAVHPIYNYALVVDDTRNSLMAVDLVTNERVTLGR